MVFLWLVLFGIAWGMFRLVDRFGVEMLGDAAIAISEVLMPRMLAIAALVLQAMLVLSCGLLAFQSFFRSTEMRLLLGTPAPLRAIAAAKLAEVAFFGAWSAAYLGSPVLLAYGLVRHAPWTLYPLALLAFIPFVVIPAALGCMLALVAATAPAAAAPGRAAGGARPRGGGRRPGAASPPRPRRASGTAWTSRAWCRSPAAPTTRTCRPPGSPRPWWRPGAATPARSAFTSRC